MAIECALVIGATGRLGSAILNLISPDFVTICVARSVSQRRSEMNDKRVYIGCDMRSDAQVEALVLSLTSRFFVRYVVFAAGDGSHLGPSHDTHLYKDFAIAQYELNVLAPQILCGMLFHFQWKHSANLSAPPSVVLVSSTAGIRPYFNNGQSSYAGSKAALNAIVMHMSHEMFPFGVHVNGVAPDSFPSNVPTETVAASVMQLAISRSTGQLLEVS